MAIFKVHFGRLTLKIYTKGERVLRIKGIVHNVKALRCGRRVEQFPVIVARLGDMVQRFLEVLRCVDVAWISDDTWEQLPTPSVVGKTRVGGVDVNKPRMCSAMEAVVALSLAPTGFAAAEFAVKMQAIMGRSDPPYTPRHAAYDLKKLRGKQLVQKIPQSRRYEPTPQGLRTMAAMIILREKVLKPRLAAAGHRKAGPKPKNRGPLDDQYELMQTQMQQMFQMLKIAA